MDADNAEIAEGNQAKQTIVYVASRQLAQIASLLPSNRNRSVAVHALVNACGLFSSDYSTSRAIRVLKPVPADVRALSHYHTRDYLDYVLNAQTLGPQSKLTSEFGLEDDCPLFKGLHEYVPLVAGASLTGAKALKDGDCEIGIVWDGGRHHAQKSRASGYCYVADCILAILALKRTDTVSGRKPKVMYLDLDLHFSDAVSQAFHSPGQASAQVLTLSIHHSSPGFYPVSTLSGLPDPDMEDFDPYTLSLPLLGGASNTTYARIWPLIERIHEAFMPDYVVVQCGLDGLAGDPCATFNWSLGGGEGSLGWCFQRIVEGWTGRKLFLGGGGYHTPNAARGWAYLTSIALGKPLNLEDEIPDHKAFSLYAPSYTFDVPKGNMVDQNSEEYLTSVEECYQQAIAVLER